MSLMNAKIKVIGIIFQNNFGARYYSKFFTKHSGIQFKKAPYNLETIDGQKAFEKGILQKVSRMNVVSKLKPQQNQIFSFANLTVLLKVINELQIYLVCEEDENYFLMESVINCIGSVLQMVTKEQFVGKVIYDNLESIMIATDEIIDEGLIVCLDPNLVYDRMKMREGTDSNSNKKPQNKQQPPPAPISFTSFFGFAKNSLQKTLNLG